MLDANYLFINLFLNTARQISPELSRSMVAGSGTGLLELVVCGENSRVGGEYAITVMIRYRKHPVSLHWIKTVIHNETCIEIELLVLCIIVKLYITLVGERGNPLGTDAKKPCQGVS